MPTPSTDPSPAGRNRADVRRNERALLDAAAAVFVRPRPRPRAGDRRRVRTRHGHHLPPLSRPGGSGSRRFKHQVDALATTTPTDPTDSATDPPYQALRTWVHRFADFLVTKHGLAEAMHSDQAGFENLHNEFVERLLPVSIDC
ncbi:TetR family transcriptional regulator OS=Streptomyces griseorubiginosus OX=67304 GN=AQJ54_39540 PE=4 SV=1 [Streptomyces griseorubiginosus]